MSLNEKELPTTGLAISEVFQKATHIKLMKKNLMQFFVIDEIDYLAQLVSKTGKDILYQLTRANETIRSKVRLTLVGISNDLNIQRKTRS